MKTNRRRCARLGCKAHPMSDSEYCFQHAGGIEIERQEARRRGGLTRSAPKVIKETFSLQTICEVKMMLQKVANAALIGEIDLNRARVAGYLASLVITCIKDYDLEKRMEAIEAKLAEINIK